MKRNRKAIRYAKSDLLFMTVNSLMLALVALVMVYPLLYVVASSFSSGSMVGGGLSLIPRALSLEGYKAVIEYGNVWIGYRNSLLYVSIGTAVSLAVTVLCAYPLSRKGFLGGRVMMALCIFTMYFSGGLVPTYLWIRQMGLLNSMWAIILPVCLSIYNMIVMRTYFATQIPEEMIEAASIDGCGEWRFLALIALPLSGPILAVIGLYYAVAQWNSYFYAVIYLKDIAKQPLTYFLREILIINNSASLESSMDPTQLAMVEKRAEIMKYSLIVFASFPVMMLYPFVQKFFVKGVMIGAVKG